MRYIYEGFCFDLVAFVWLSGGSGTANLLQALEDYLPVLLGLVKESEHPIIQCFASVL